MEAGTAMQVARRSGQECREDASSNHHNQTVPVENPWDDESGAEPWSLHLTGDEHAHLLKALTPLTPREREVACAVCMGGDNEAVADRLCIAVPTLRTHLMRINQKLGTASKGDLVRFVSSRLLDGYRCREIAPSAAPVATSERARGSYPQRAAAAPSAEPRRKSSLPMTTG